VERFRVDQIDHVELFVPDRHEAAGWYERVLGLEVVAAFRQWADDPSGPLMISSDGGNTKLALFSGKPQGTAQTAGFHRVAFGVTANGFIAFLGRLEDLQVTDHLGRRVAADDVVDHERSYSIYFADPYGNRLELTTYDDDEVRASLNGHVPG
jgi:catechol 2,3-dioxygenase-like lactoylglutathione lyase family enzyme